MASNREFNPLVHKIVSYLPQVEMVFDKNEDSTLLDIFFLDRECCLTFSVDDDWQNVKRRLDKYIIEERPTECPICMEDLKEFRSCRECAGELCHKCLYSTWGASLHRRSILCPFCRTSLIDKDAENLIDRTDHHRAIKIVPEV